MDCKSVQLVKGVRTARSKVSEPEGCDVQQGDWLLMLYRIRGSC